MNKKGIAALSVAGVLLSQGSVAVFAEEMVEVEAGSVGGTDVEQATEIALDDINFPDDNFRAAVKIAYSKVANLTLANSITSATLNFSNADSAVPNTTKAKIDDLSNIVTLVSSETDPTKPVATTANNAADYDYAATAIKSFKDLTGIEYLTGLQYLSVLHSPQLKVVNLTENNELVEVALVPYPSASTTNTVPSIADQLSFKAPTAPATTPIQINHSELYSLVLPEETDNLEKLTVGGASQLTTLDLSAYTSLTDVNLQLNELADLNVSGSSSVETLNVAGNELTGLDLSTLSSMSTLDAQNNNLYEISFPSGKKLTTIDLSDNKLATLDTSNLRGLTTLNVEDNRLENLDLSSNGSLTNLNVMNNHLATLDLSESGLVNTATSTDAYNPTNGVGAAATKGTLSATPQFLYANVDDAGIDLASYDENFQASTGNPAVGWMANTTGAGAITTNVTGGSINKSGVFELDSDAVNSYSYNVGTTASNPMRVVVVRADLMNRLYNPNSGEHFYTKDLNEKDTLVKLGWQYEGIGWVAPKENSTALPTAAGEAVFRLYNPNAGDHHYTKDSKEKDVLVRAGWDYEGVGWYSAKDHDDTPVSNGLTIVPPTTLQVDTITSYSIEVYREYNPNAKEAGAHNYTTSENENDTLVALGWLDEGIGWWALK